MKTNKPSFEILKKIMRAKYILDHACIHANGNTEFDSMLSLQHMDHAMEFMLRIIIEHCDIENEMNSTSETMSMVSLIGLIDKFCACKKLGRIPYKKELKHLRDLRNHVQHAGVLPVSEIQGQLSMAFRAFERCLQNYFDTKMTDVRYSTIVQNQTLKKIVEEIENSLDAKKYLASVVASRNAFEYAKIFVLEYLKRTPEKLPLLLLKSDYDERLIDYFTELEERQTLNNYGIDLYLYDKFKEYIGHIPSEYNAALIGGYTIMQREWNESDAEFCYGFVIEAINKWQTMRINSLYEIEQSIISDIPKGSVPFHINAGDQNIYPINELAQYSCLYSHPPDWGIRMFVGKREAETLRNKLLIKNEYDSSFGRIVVDRISISIASNFVPAWEVCMWFHLVQRCG